MFPSKYNRQEKLPNNSEKVNFILKIPAKVKVTSNSSSCVHIVPLFTFFMFLPCCEHETCLNKASDCISCNADYVYLNNSSRLFLEQISKSSLSSPVQIWLFCRQLSIISVLSLPSHWPEVVIHIIYLLWHGLGPN